MTPVGTHNEQFRIDWIARALKQLPAGQRLLDAGAGEQQYRKFCAHLQYVSQDFAQYDPAATPAGLQYGDWDYGKLDIVSDITAIPEPKESFDVILCAEVFEHIPDPLKAIAEFARLLKPGGTLILTAPFCSMTHFAPYHFASGFNRYFYEHHLPAAGFDILELTPNGNYFQYVAQELRRRPDMASRYGGMTFRRWHFWLNQKMLNILERLNAADRGSSELLCYGFHVVARKR